MPTISELKHRVALCSAKDVITNNGVMALSRELVQWTWARIEGRWNLPSFIGRNGYALMESVDRPTHLIAIRAAVGLEITSAAWVYEQRRKSAPRWYKVLGFFEEGAWITLTTHLVERSDQASPPSDLSACPQGVEL